MTPLRGPGARPLVTVPLQAGKTPSSVTLPDTSDSPVSSGPTMHVFGLAVGN